MTLEWLEKWAYRFAILTLPLGTIWLWSFGSVRGTPWAFGNLGIGVGECFVFVAVMCAMARGNFGLKCPGQSPDRLAKFSIPAYFLALIWFGLLFGRALSSDFQFVAILGTVRYVLAGLLLMIAAPISTEEIAQLWILGMIIPGLLAVLQIFVWHAGISSTLLGIAAHPLMAPGTSVIEIAGERFMRAYGSFAHPNIFGAYLVLSLILLLRDWRSSSRIILLVFGFILALTFSRGAILAFGAYFIAEIFLKTVPIKRFLPIGFGLIIGIMIFLPVYGARIDVNGERLEKKSTNQRIESLATGFELFKRNPLVGVGVFQSVPALAIQNPSKSVWDFEPAHFMPLLMLAEWGILGFSVFIALVFLMWCDLGREKRRKLIPVIAAACVLGAFDHALLTSSQLLFLFALSLKVVLDGDPGTPAYATK
ncbi:MAG: O-antigen ligase family protein [bacterium]